MRNLIIFIILVIGFTGINLSAQESDPEVFKALARKSITSKTNDVQIPAEKGDAKAQVVIGLTKVIEAENLENDPEGQSAKFKEAFAWFMKAGRQNYAPAQYFLALAYYRKQGVSQDCEIVINYLDKAIAANYAAAYWYKGGLYLVGKCVGPEDYEKSLELSKKSYSLGYLWAAYGIGDALDHIGGEKNQKEATKWFLEAATRGTGNRGNPAQNQVGIRFSRGIGVKVDNRAAVEWFKKSAEGEDAYGACNLSLHYAKGLGIAKNLVLAMKWSIIANDLLELDCKSNPIITRLKPKQAEIRQANILAVAWLQKHPYVD